MIRDLLKREVVKQFIRFALVGLESTILTYLLFTVFIEFLLLNYIISYIISVFLGTLFGFLFNKLFTFRSERKAIKEIFIYLLVYFISLTIGGFILKLLVEDIGINPLIATIPVLMLTTLLNFFGTKILAFRNRNW